jgi:hypothetical protein
VGGKMKNQYYKKTIEKLLKIQEEIIKNPKNKNDIGGSIYKFKKLVRVRLDMLGCAIESKRKKQNNYVDGES